MKKIKDIFDEELFERFISIISIAVFLLSPDDNISRIVIIIILCTFRILTLPLKGNNLFVLSIFACALFILIPYFLTYSDVAFLISDFLSELKTVEYKSTYIEAIGSFLGSFLAITGALWIENRMRADKEKDDDSLNSRIVYYDLEFAFKQICMILEGCSENKNGIKSHSDFKNYSDYHKKIQDYIVLIDKEWIRIVSSLPENEFDAIRREQIYVLYDYLCKIECKLKKIPDSFDKEHFQQYKKLYKTMYDFLLIAPEDYRPTFVNVPLSLEIEVQRNTTADVWKILKKHAKIPQKPL